MDDATLLLERINALAERVAALEKQERVIDDTAATASTIARRDSSGNLTAAAITGTLGTFTSGVAVTRSGGTAVFGIDASGTGSALTLANNATGTPFGNANNFSGVIFINETAFNGINAVFLCAGGVTSLLAESAAGYYTNTATTANRANIYYSANVLTIENKQGGSRTFNVFGIRTRASA